MKERREGGVQGWSRERLGLMRSGQVRSSQLDRTSSSSSIMRRDKRVGEAGKIIKTPEWRVTAN